MPPPPQREILDPPLQMLAQTQLSQTQVHTCMELQEKGMPGKTMHEKSVLP